mmetsp:Transcript_20401/g.52007  ORF Transcript_20401/g.52007 Transcript_20401/m.52007 type:complete len:297 (+) Transcript_20401:95-985(+)
MLTILGMIHTERALLRVESPALTMRSSRARELGRPVRASHLRPGRLPAVAGPVRRATRLAPRGILDGAHVVILTLAARHLVARVLEDLPDVVVGLVADVLLDSTHLARRRVADVDELRAHLHAQALADAVRGVAVDDDGRAQLELEAERVVVELVLVDALLVLAALVLEPHRQVRIDGRLWRRHRLGLDLGRCHDRVEGRLGLVAGLQRRRRLLSEYALLRLLLAAEEESREAAAQQQERQQEPHPPRPALAARPRDAVLLGNVAAAIGQMQEGLTCGVGLLTDRSEDGLGLHRRD